MVSTNHIKTNPVGLDFVIQEMQVGLFDFLTTNWSGLIQGFGRVYRNAEDIESPVPEWFNGIDYTPVYYDDQWACNLFFMDDQTHETKDGFLFEAKVKVALMMDLDKVLPNFAHRPDSEAQKAVVGWLNQNSIGNGEITAIAKGIDAVFLGWDKRGIKFNDMHPYHTFCVKMNVQYYLDEC